MLLLFATSNMVYAEVTSKEKDALIGLHKSTNGLQWIKKWDLNSPVSQWHGVKVLGGHVVEINLFRNNLMGPIPESIGELQHLTSLNLAFNNITGELPTSIVKLSNLKDIKVGNEQA